MQGTCVSREKEVQIFSPNLKGVMFPTTPNLWLGSYIVSNIVWSLNSYCLFSNSECCFLFLLYLEKWLATYSSKFKIYTRIWDLGNVLSVIFFVCFSLCFSCGLTFPDNGGLDEFKWEWGWRKEHQREVGRVPR